MSILLKCKSWNCNNWNFLNQCKLKNRSYTFQAPAAVILGATAIAYQINNKSAQLESDIIVESVNSQSVYKIDEEIDEQTKDYDPELAKYIGMSQLNANAKIEDRMLARTITIGKSKAVLCSVIDGHGGPRVAATVYKNLVKYVQAEIDRLNIHSTRDVAKLKQALHAAYVTLDKDLYRQTQISMPSIPLWTRWKCGACCLSVLITSKDCIVANAGDCEGVMSYPLVAKKFIKLVKPHSANEPDEQIRLQREHPGESDVVKCKRTSKRPVKPVYIFDRLSSMFRQTMEDVQSSCYVKGRLMPTRSFGDFHLKYKECAHDKINDKKLVSPPYSFPYITATPEIFHTRIPRYTPSYMVIGSDGIFDFLEHSEIHEAIRDSHFQSYRPKSIASSLVHNTISKAASLRNRNIFELLNATTEGKHRRRLFDDTSACVIDLKEIRKFCRK